MTEKRNSVGVQTELPLKYVVKRVAPEFYKVIQPNILIQASNSEFKIAEHRLYTEILSQNHKNEPEQLFYTFPYSIINPKAKKATKNAWRDAEPIIDRLQSIVLKLPKVYVEKVYGKSIKRVSFNPFNKVIYEEGRFTVRLDDDFKRILVITKDHFTRGELELLRELSSEWSHKIYWLIREKQPWNGTMEIKIEELRSALGLGDRYKNRYDNFKTKVLKVAESELKNTWAEFRIEEIRGGRGGKEVLAIKFLFRSDVRHYLRQQKDLRFNYEIQLSENKIPVATIHDIRKKIYYGEKILEDRPEVWDFYYVEQTIDIMQSKKTVKDPANYLYKALYEGTFLNEVEKRRKYFNPGKQLDVFGEKIVKGNQGYSIPFEQFENDAREMKLTVEELCKRAKYEIVETEEGKFAFKIS
jgi:plasmid replication initiation protein